MSQAIDSLHTLQSLLPNGTAQRVSGQNFYLTVQTLKSFKFQFFASNPKRLFALAVKGWNLLY